MKTVNYAQPGASMHGYATVPATSDAKEYLRLILRHKVGLLLTFLLGIGLAALYLISATPVYESSALVEVREDGNIIDRDNQQPINWNAPTIKEEANILKSRKVLAPVVENFDLRTHAEPNTVPVLGDLTERLPALAGWIGGLDVARSYAWRDSHVEIATLDVPRRWEDEPITLSVLAADRYALSLDDRVLLNDVPVGETAIVEMGNDTRLSIAVAAIDAEPGVEFTLLRQSLTGAIGALNEQLSTESTDTKSRMITVKLRGEDPQLTADLVNAIVQEYRDVKLSSDTLQSSTELQFYEESLPRLEAELRDAESALAEFRTRANAINQDVQTEQKLAQLDKLEQQMTELQIEKDELTERYTDVHPSFRRLNKEIDVLQRKINQIRNGISSAPSTDRELNILLQQEETARKVYIEMKEKLQKARIALAGNVPSVQLWDQALPPRNPISPNTLLAVVGGTVTTMFLYLLFLTLRSALTTVISDQDSLERASGLPVYMNIPKSTAQRRLGASPTVDPRRLLPGSSSGGDSAAEQNVLALSKPEDFSIENLRGLRSMMEDVMNGADNNVLMICSPLPGMGKSFLSLNLSVLLAQAGKRVLLIDADYQRGQLHKALGLAMGPGLPEVVRGKSELKESVKATSVQNLYCIPRGFMGDGIARQMPSDKEFGAFLGVVAPRFDIAIIDTPPVLSVSTASSIGKHAGSSIMVVKEGEVKEPQLNEALKRLSFSGVRVSGCILNGSSSATPRHYSYYREQLD